MTPDPGSRLPCRCRARGDLWILRDHRLLRGDASRVEDLVRLMGDDRAALLVTDPPYCVSYTGTDRPQSSGKDWSHVYREIDIKDLGESWTAS